MKKDEFLKMETAEANIELDEIKNKDNKITSQKGASSTTEVNIAIQEDFYDDSHEEVLLTYMHSNTPVIKITGKD